MQPSHGALNKLQRAAALRCPELRALLVLEVPCAASDHRFERHDARSDQEPAFESLTNVARITKPHRIGSVVRHRTFSNYLSASRLNRLVFL